MHLRIRLFAHGTAPFLIVRTLELADGLPLELPLDLDRALFNLRPRTHHHLTRSRESLHLGERKRRRTSQVAYAVTRRWLPLFHLRFGPPVSHSRSLIQ